MLIRPMREGDWPAVARIFRQGIDAGNATMHAFVPDYETWNASRDAAPRLVAEKSGRVLGWVTLSPVSTRACYRGVKELAVYVDASARGQGVGGALLTALIRESEKSGIWMLEAHIFEENIASQKLHEKCGFRMVGYRERIGFDGQGVWHNTMLMERRSHAVKWQGDAGAAAPEA